jgi:hypothetical protein
MTWPKRVVTVVALLGLYGSEFFYFLLPTAFWWLIFIAGLVCWIPLFHFSLGAVFRRRWKLISIFAIVWVLLSPVFLGVWAPRIWLRGQGFHVRTLLTKDYLSRCKLTEFVENGIKQTVGWCEGGSLTYDYFDFIVYDTTGNSALPVSQRSLEWKRWMAKATQEGVVSREHPTYHLFGNFYATTGSVFELGPEPRTRD